MPLAWCGATTSKLCSSATVRPVRPTSPLHVVVAIAVGLAIGTSVPEISDRLSVVAPRPGWAAPVGLLVLAIGLALTARSTWRNLRVDKRVVHSELGVRLLVLAKAAALVGGLFLGGYAGLAIAYVSAWDTVFGRERVLQGAAAAFASILVLVAALLLERALRVPGPDDDDDSSPGATPA